VTPGTDLYIWVKATTGSFVSDMQTLDVPERPETPAVTIDFLQENTAEIVPATVEYSTQADMTSPFSGADTVLALTPGSDLYLRGRATASDFASGIQHLIIPPRPAASVYTINFVWVKTNENIPVTEEYAAQPDMTGAVSGTGTRLDLTPGETVYFRVKSTDSSFFSLPYELAVPPKPKILSEVGDTVESDFFQAVLDFHTTPTDGFDLSDIEMVNAQLTSISEFTVKVTPGETGQVSMKIVANALDAGNFASETLSSYYRNVTAMRDVLSAEGSLRVYPSPVKDVLKVEAIRNLSLPLEIRVLDCNGVVTLQQKMFDSQTTIDMNSFPAGLFILLAVDAEGRALTCKVIKQ
jgi:hypothetical protein